VVLRPGELAALRAPYEQRMQATATVFRKAQVSDGMGGYVDSYVETRGYPCNFTPFPITPIERETATQVQAITFWRFVFPAGADILPTDRIMVGARGFEVVQASVGMIEIQHAVLCQEIV